MRLVWGEAREPVLADKPRAESLCLHRCRRESEKVLCPPGPNRGCELGPCRGMLRRPHVGMGALEREQDWEEVSMTAHESNRLHPRESVHSVCVLVSSATWSWVLGTQMRKSWLKPPHLKDNSAYTPRERAPP